MEKSIGVKQDLFESVKTYGLKVDITKIIIEKYPNLNSSCVEMLGNAFIKKLYTGEIFTPSIESVLSTIQNEIFPLLKQ